MYIENSSNNRDRWCYEYTGKDLLPYAQAKYKEVLRKERDARERMAGYMKDMNMSQADSKVHDCKHDIEKYGTLREQCSVWVYQFDKEQDRKFSLAMGDVVFFGLVKENLEA
jgi:hypothetical protein